MVILQDPPWPVGLWGGLPFQMASTWPIPTTYNSENAHPSKSKMGILINGTSAGGDFFHLFFLFSPAQKNGED